MNFSSALEKPALREWAKQQRKRLDRDSLSRQIVQRLITIPPFIAANTVLLYQATFEEIDVSQLIASNGKQWLLPRCASEKRLSIHPVNSKTVLTPGLSGILEPAADLPTISPLQIDLVVVPGLLYTREGKRLGYGGGYYDRFLPQLRADANLIAVCPSAMLVENLPSDPWDVHVQWVVTESELIDCSSAEQTVDSSRQPGQ